MQHIVDFFRAQGEDRAAELAQDAAKVHLFAAVESGNPLLHWNLTPDCLGLLPPGEYWARALFFLPDGNNNGNQCYRSIFRGRH